MAGTLGSRAVVNDSPEGLEIVIPAPRIWPLVVFMGCWLAGWATGESFALREILTPAPTPARAFLAVWLLFWTFGGLGALSVCLWMLAGHERIRLRPDALTIQREAFGLGPVRTYALDQITNLVARAMPPVLQATVARSGQAPDRTIQVTPDKTQAVLRVIGIGGPGISFTCGGKAVRFGVALDPMEAQMVVSQLQGRHSFGVGSIAT
jgi:hypothetical protein